MFPVEQIKAAHTKVKSGAGFFDCIKEIKALGLLVTQPVWPTGILTITVLLNVQQHR